MEKNERNDIYAVPFIGGILCIMSLFYSDIWVAFSFNLVLGMILSAPILAQASFGIVMLIYAIKIRRGKSSLMEEKKKFLIFSWLAVSVSLGFSVFIFFVIELFGLSFPYGFVGGLLTILGIYYHQYITKDTKYTDQQGKKIEQEKEFYTKPKFCTNCGFNLKEGSFKFCPECGNQLTP